MAVMTFDAPVSIRRVPGTVRSRPEALARPARQPGPARPVARPLARPRLTARGRRLVGLVLLLGAAAGVLPALRPAVAGPVNPPPARFTVVAGGDTLWDIALRAAPGTDPRRTVAEIERLNELTSSAVRPGQRLRLPAS